MARPAAGKVALRGRLWVEWEADLHYLEAGESRVAALEYLAERLGAGGEQHDDITQNDALGGTGEAGDLGHHLEPEPILSAHESLVHSNEQSAASPLVGVRNSPSPLLL